MTEKFNKPNEGQENTVDGLDYADYQLINGTDFNEWTIEAKREHFAKLRQSYANNP